MRANDAMTIHAIAPDGTKYDIGVGVNVVLGKDIVDGLVDGLLPSLGGVEASISWNMSTKDMLRFLRGVGTPASDGMVKKLRSKRRYERMMERMKPANKAKV